MGILDVYRANPMDQHVDMAKLKAENEELQAMVDKQATRAVMQFFTTAGFSVSAISFCVAVDAPSGVALGLVSFIWGFFGLCKCLG